MSNENETVATFDTNESGLQDVRIALLDGIYYVFYFDAQAGGISDLDGLYAIGKYLDDNIRQCGRKFKTESGARRYVKRLMS